MSQRAQGRERVATLVDAFSAGIGEFKNPRYDEAKLRRGFIDPFFEELGWPVEEAARSVGSQRAVVIEDRDGTGGRADYGFYSGRHLKFFVEVKRPAIAITRDRDAIFQAKSYAWHKKIGLVLLTDFEETTGLFGGVRPRREKPKAGLLGPLSLYYTEYADRFDLLWDVLSYEAVRDGAVERFLLDQVGAQKGRARDGAWVDEAFLSELD